MCSAGDFENLLWSVGERKKEEGKVCISLLQFVILGGFS